MEVKKEVAVSRAWYVIALLGCLPGGVIGYVVVRNENRRVANRLLWVGIAGTFTVLPAIGLAVFYPSAYLALSRLPAILQQQNTSSTRTQGLYIQGITFQNGNVTVSVSNAGGGTPWASAQGRIARGVGSILVYDGKLYYRYDWECAPTQPCNTAPGPWRYFTFEGTSTSLHVPWNQTSGGVAYGLPMTVNGLASIPLNYQWKPNAQYTVYLEDVENNIVDQVTIRAPSQ